MSKVVLVTAGEKIFAVPTEVCEKYELEGKELEAAKEALIPDVEGQLVYKDYEDGRHEAWVQDSNGNYSRAPWYDIGY